MKKFILCIVTLLFCFTINAGESSYYGNHPDVYVVMSNTAYAYHRTTNCSAVRKATHPARQVSYDEATQKMRRKPCKLCYGD